MTEKTREFEKIAYIRNGFTTKFGIPRQSGLAEISSEIIFYPEYRVAEAFRGLEEYSHLWLLWEFSEAVRENWSPTVRPPRLGGNQRMGVFATRSPFRPNPIGLSVVKLIKIDWESEEGPLLLVSGADLMNGTPIFDVKPYLPYVDSHPDARTGFAGRVMDYELQVVFPEVYKKKVPSCEVENLIQLLRQDPRPAYQKDPERIYGMEYAGMEVKFCVVDQVVTVCGITYVKNT